MRLALAIAAALSLQSPAKADTLIDNVDGLTLTADGRIQRFAAVLVGDDGRIEQLFQPAEKRPSRVDYRLDGKGRVLMPGLIDSNVALMRLALARTAPPTPGARPRPEDRDQALIEVQKALLERGITTVIDMGTTIEDWQSYRRAGDAGTLSLRIIGYAASADDMVLIAGPRPTPWLYEDRLRLVGLKIVYSPPTAATALPARPLRNAAVRAAPRPADAMIQIKNLLSRAGIDGFQAAIQVQGPASLPPLLDAITELAQTYKGERRWRIELAAMPPDGDLARIGQQGVVLGLAPIPPDAQTALAALGATKVRHTFGSGAVEALPDPFPALAGSLRREDALAAQTSGAAWAAFGEGRIGRIAIGQRADFILLDRDPLLASLAELRTIRVLQTWVGGRMVYRAKEDAAPVTEPVR